ncbi:MAG: hypothetical protein IPI81_04915 [Flavobacteriales bacterium]|nr:hypothetical protein [Flavobacteriales bacterium]MCC6939295.1 hypothetical protein [Flavobacteriales bacterium]
MKRRLHAFLFSFLVASTANAQDGHFEILRGDQVLGRIRVERVITGNTVSYSMISASTFDLIWKRHVRTTVITHYTDGRVTGCCSSVRMNNAVRDSSLLRSIGGRGLYFKHPTSVHADDLPANEWTTARMYYEEPAGESSIFVESALADCPLVHSGVGEYSLTLPNKDRNHYIYRDGVLQEIRVDRGFFVLLFRRV